jgi:hypothetical protein
MAGGAMATSAPTGAHADSPVNSIRRTKSMAE